MAITPANNTQYCIIHITFIPNIRTNILPGILIASQNNCVPRCIMVQADKLKTQTGILGDIKHLVFHGMMLSVYPQKHKTYITTEAVQCTGT